MNLENLNLVELNAQEVREVEGGILPAVLFFVGLYLWGEFYKSSNGMDEYGRP